MTAALFVLAIVAALRGTWSPCGLSMLSTITPLAERARGHHYWVSAAWFALGATLGGATLGVYMQVVSWACHRSPIPSDLRVGAALVIAAVCIAADARIGGFELPDHPRQVDQTWVDRYRPWVYAGGFGWQIGTGLCTYVMTNAVYTVALVGAVVLAPWQALAVGVAFGATRGATILIGARVTTPQRLRGVHRRLAASDVASLTVTMAAQLVFIVVCVADLQSPAAGAIGALCACALALGCVTRAVTLSRRSLVGAR